MVNDEKPLVKIADSGVTVYGTPWNDKHRLGENISAPLRAHNSTLFLSRFPAWYTQRKDGFIHPSCFLLFSCIFMMSCCSWLPL